MKRTALACLLILLVCTAGCTTKTGPAGAPDRPTGGINPQKFADEYTLYETGPLPLGWKRLWGYDADLAFYNAIHRATIFVNSTCGLRKPVPSVALRNHLLFDLTDRHIFEQSEVELDMRTGLHTMLQGRLDGGLIKMEVYVVQIDTCIYDFVYISSIEQFDACKEDFRKFVFGFHAKRKG